MIHASVNVKVNLTYFPSHPLSYQRLDSWDSMHPHNMVLHPQNAQIPGLVMTYCPCITSTNQLTMENTSVTSLSLLTICFHHYIHLKEFIL